MVSLINSIVTSVVAPIKEAQADALAAILAGVVESSNDDAAVDSNPPTVGG